MEKEFTQGLKKALAVYPGKYFLRYEQDQLNTLLGQFPGFYLIQLGQMNAYDLKSTSTILHHIYVEEEISDESNTCQVKGKFSELPFQYESVDLFILPHTLEFTHSPDKLLNEIYSVLVPGGRVIVLGFNPYSFVGLFKLFQRGQDQAWSGKLHDCGHVKFWLRASGFEISYQRFFCYRPPLKSVEALKKIFFLELLGPFIFPHMGGAYILVAEKKSPSVPPLRRAFSRKLRVPRGLPEPSINKSS